MRLLTLLTSILTVLLVSKVGAFALTVATTYASAV